MKSQFYRAFRSQIRFLSAKTFQRKTNDVKIDILSGKREGIYVLSFNRPAVRNAVNRNMIEELSGILDELSCSQEVRVIVLHSTTPGVFCSGADLKERQQLSSAETYRTVTSFRALTNQLESVPIPTIAAIDGFALGGGFEIALACDIRVASIQARFGLVETKLAIIPGAGGTQRLPRVVGPAIAKELIFTGRVIDARAAHDYGIVNHVVESKALEKSLQISDEILPNGPVGIRMAKTAINKGLQVDIGTGCAIEESCYAQVIPTKDRLEGIAAFLSKRPPNYTGE